MNPNISGKVWKFADHIDTDVIIPGKYLRTTDMKVFAEHAMEGIDPDFSKKVSPGDIIVAGENFGCGSSREQAPLALKYAGISCVVARSFARIFFRNAMVSPSSRQMSGASRVIYAPSIWDRAGYIAMERTIKAQNFPISCKRYYLAAALSHTGKNWQRIEGGIVQ